MMLSKTASCSTSELIPSSIVQSSRCPCPTQVVPTVTALVCTQSSSATPGTTPPTVKSDVSESVLGAVTATLIFLVVITFAGWTVTFLWQQRKLRILRKKYVKVIERIQGNAESDSESLERLLFNPLYNTRNGSQANNGSHFSPYEHIEPLEEFAYDVMSRGNTPNSPTVYLASHNPTSEQMYNTLQPAEVNHNYHTLESLENINAPQNESQAEALEPGATNTSTAGTDGMDRSVVENSSGHTYDKLNSVKVNHNYQTLESLERIHAPQEESQTESQHEANGAAGADDEEWVEQSVVENASKETQVFGTMIITLV